MNDPKMATPDQGRSPASTNYSHFAESILSSLPRSGAETAGRPELIPHGPDSFPEVGGRAEQYNS